MGGWGPTCARWLCVRAGWGRMGRRAAPGGSGGCLRAYLQVGPVPGVLGLHLAQQRFQLPAQPGLGLRLRHIVEGCLQRGPQRVDVGLRQHQRAHWAWGRASQPPGQHLSPGSRCSSGPGAPALYRAASPAPSAAILLAPGHPHAPGPGVCAGPAPPAPAHLPGTGPRLAQALSSKGQPFLFQVYASKTDLRRRKGRFLAVWKSGFSPVRVGLFTPCPLGQAHRAGLSPQVLEGLPTPAARCPPTPSGLLASSQDRARGASSSPLHSQEAETREVQEPAGATQLGQEELVGALGHVTPERWVTQLRSRGRAPRGRLSPPPCPGALPSPTSESPTSSPGPTLVQGQHLARASLSMAEWWGPVRDVLPCLLT